MKYYIAKVKVVTTDDKGRQKKMQEQYCIHAVSVTDAETKVHEEFKNDGLEFEVTHVNETKIIKVISKLTLAIFVFVSIIYASGIS